MKVTISQKELDDYIRYRRFMRTNPCEKCKDKGYCCGCLTQSTWARNLEPYEYVAELGDSFGRIKEYAELTLDISEAKHKADEWEHKAFMLKRRKAQMDLSIRCNGNDLIMFDVWEE